MNNYKFNKSEHIHLLNDRPLLGCSTVAQMMPKVLTWWASAKACEIMGWTNPKTTKKADRIIQAEKVYNEITNGNLDSYIELLDTAYKAHSVKLKDAAKKGTDLHGELEAFVKDQINKQEGIYPDNIKPFIDWSEDNVDRFLWSEAYCYSESMWVGGICDVGMVLKDGRVAVGDFKSGKAWDSAFVQEADYSITIEENGLYDAEGNKLNIVLPKIDTLITIPFGNEVFKPDIKPIGHYCEGFRACLALHKFTQSLKGEKK